MVIVESAGLTDVGKIRQSNEDCIFIDDAQGLYLVADGMGGHRAGEVASTLVVQSIRDFLAKGGPADNHTPCPGSLSSRAHRLLASIEWSNRIVYQTACGQEDYRGMGSTVAAVYFSEDTVIAANVGDSPIYLARNGTINLLSVPHTLQAALPADAQAPFMGNILTRAVGPKNLVEADICELNCFKDDQLVICSDGLSTKVAPQEILSLTTSLAPDSACRAMVQLANERGGDDNISAVVLRVVGVRRQHGSIFKKWFCQVRNRLAAI